MADAVTPERILKDLYELWGSMAKSDANGILRACSMTLVVAADEEEEASVLGEMLAEIMHEHPSRAIVLRVRDGDDAELEAKVVAQCWMPFGRRQQICCEQIEIHASENGMWELPRLVLGLMAPDLPAILVCRTPKLFTMPSFGPLLDLAGKVIVDSRRAKRPQFILREIIRRRADGHDVHDLAWTALTEWRESIARAFDDGEWLAKIPHIERIAITLNQQSGKSESWYLGAWLRHIIGPQSRVDYLRGSASEPVQQVELTGEGVSMVFSRGSGSGLQTVRNGVANNMPFALSSDWDLIRDELSILERDRIYAEVLPMAVALSGG